MNPHMLTKIRSKPLRAAIAGMPCTLRISSFIPGHKCSGVDTVIPAHLPIWGRGTSTKVTDAAICAACFNCHELLDARDSRSQDIMLNYGAGVTIRMLHALTETHAMLIDKGIIEIKGMEIV